MRPLYSPFRVGFLFVAVLAACFRPCAASGRDSKGRLSSWDNLNSLTQGQEIRVQMNDDKSYQGAFESLSKDGITLRQPAGAQALARKDITRISQLNGQNHRVRNQLIGAAVGAGLGLGVGLGYDKFIWDHTNCTEGPLFNCSGPPFTHWGIVLPPVGGVTGAIIGALVPTGGWRDIYRSPGGHHLIYRAR